VNWGGPEIRAAATRLAVRLLRPAGSDDSRAEFWVRHVRVGVAISEIAAVIASAYFLLGDRPHRYVALGIAVAIMLLSPLLLLLPIVRLTAGLAGLAIFYLWSVAIVVVISTVALLDGGVESPLNWLLLLAMVFAALAYPPLGVVLIGIYTTAAFALIAVLDSAVNSYSLMVVAALGIYTIMATWVSHNQWRVFDQQRRLTQQLAAADHARQQFLASTSHELRTPVTSILGYLELLEEELGPDHRRYLDILQRNAERLRDLAESLVVLSRLESEEAPRAPSGTADGADLGEVASWARQTMAPLAAAQRVTLSLDLPDHPLKVPGSEEQIEQVLLNLLSNAVKYTPEDGSVVCSMSRVGTQARIEVRDTGIGMAQGDVERLFTRYFRAESARASSIDGVGLGLSIVHEIVTAHGGHIEVSSRLGEGTSIVVLLPLLPASRSAPRSATAMAPVRAARGTS
jgi:signal transduction histidine kinase